MVRLSLLFLSNHPTCHSPSSSPPSPPQPPSVALHLLLNLGEDLGVEVKMVKRGILPLLLDLLSRKGSSTLYHQQNNQQQQHDLAASGELVHYLCLIFLFKLCVFQENKDMLIAVRLFHYPSSGLPFSSYFFTNKNTFFNLWMI